MKLIIPDYTIKEVIHQGKFSLIYKAFHNTSKKSVVIKLLNNENPTPLQIARFQHEYNITKSLHTVLPDLIIQPIDFIPVNGTFVIILEDFHAISLKKGLISGPLDVAKFIQMSIKIADIVGRIHGENILIKDINSGHILWNPLTDEVKLIGLGISTKLAFEDLEPKSPDVIEGSLPYISPEQTGRMNHVVDNRSDYYSLGITFYEMLTGFVPFKSSDLLEILQAHLAHLPRPLSEVNPDVPLAISNIILKLLQKLPEDRYQSTHGLIYDLSECEKQLKEKKTISLFQVGTKDFSSTFHISERLYGREQEINLLLESFEKTGQGEIRFTLVSGLPGVGKTALVHEVHKPIAARKGYFTSGKFDQYKRDIPYESLVQAFRKLVQQILTENPEKIAGWRKILQDAVGRNGKLVTDVIPEVKLIIGPQPELVEVGPTETKNRFSFVFRNFIQAFASEQHPLTIFLDDLQWADLPTIELLSHLLSNPSSHHIFLIGSYRNNEVDETHILMLMLGDLRKLEINYHLIELHELKRHQVYTLLSDTLHSYSPAIDALTDLCYLKTQGNPFFLNQILLFLHEVHLINFDFKSGSWIFDIDEIKKKKIPDNVLEFMSVKILTLPPETRNVLELASCLGNHFELKVLADVNEKSLQDTAEDLWIAMKEGLIIPENDNYKFINEQVDLSIPYRFLHDRVQQATYSLIPESRKSFLHYKIGNLLLSHTTSDIEDKVFEIINQLNLGTEFIITPAEKMTMINLNVLASKKAKASSAFRAATTYLKVASTFLNTNAWEKNYKMTFELLKEYSTNLYIIGDHELAESIVYETLLHAKTPLEKAEILVMQVSLYLSSGKMDKAVAAGLKGLEILGVKLTPRVSKFNLLKEIILTKWNLGKRPIASLVNMPPLNDSNLQMIFKLIQETSIATFYQGNTSLTGALILKQVNLTLRYGNYPGASLAYIAFSMILTSMGYLKEGFEFGKLSLVLCERFQDERYKCRILVTYAMMVHGWNYHWKTLTSYFREAIEAGMQSGDIITSLHGCASLLLWDPEITLETVVKESKQYLNLIQQTRNQNAWNATKIEFQLRANLCGLTNGLYSLSEPGFDELESLEKMKEAKFATGLALYNICKAMIHYHYGDFYNSYHYSKQADLNSDALAGTLFYSEYCVYVFHIYAALYTQANFFDKIIFWKRLQKEYKKFKLWSEHCPVNFLHHRILMEAEMAFLQNKIDQAADLYELAIKTAKENEFTRYEALANELTGQFYLSQGKEKLAKLYLQEAKNCYDKWGAKAKVKHLEGKYPTLLPSTMPFDMAGSSSINSEATSSNVLDFISIMKASQALTREIQLPQLIEKMMHIVIENAGAEKGILFLKKDNHFVVEALASSEKVQIFPEQDLHDYPQILINRVQVTKEAIVLEDATHDKNYQNDPYIKKVQPKSILCFPLINLDNVKGLLYLENNLANNVFTKKHFDIINMLSSQMAISIDNALFYGKLEEKVQERTHALRNAQQQLLQKEKMAFLGMLTTGIAHEIKNPLNFIINFSRLSSESLDEVENFIQKNLIQEDKEMSNLLAFLKENIEYVKDQGSKADIIVNRMLEHSLEQNQEFAFTDIHHLIDQTLAVFLQKKHNPEGFTLQIEKKFDPSLQYIKISEIDIQRVLINLFNNAYYSLLQKRSHSDEFFIPKLIITTHLLLDQVEIKLKDNGEGIAIENKNKVFTPFFTTKPSGEGVGLGLSLCYNIIVEEHGGSLTFDSKEGEFTEFVINLPSRE